MALIPAERLTDWTPGSYTGVPGGIAQYQAGGASPRTNVVNVTLSPYFADNTGVTDAAPVVKQAIDDSTGTPNTTIYLPAGTYKWDTRVTISHSTDGVTIKGDGSSTLLVASTAAWFFGASDGWGWPVPPATVSSGLTKGSSTITLDDASAFTTGLIILIAFGDQDDNTDIAAGAAPVFPVGGWDPNLPRRRQVSKVIGKVGNVLTIFPEIYHDANPATALVWTAQLQHNLVGIESMKINCTDTAQNAIEMQHCYGCWVDDVEVYAFANRGIILNDSLNCEIRHCNIYDRTGWASSATNGAGILFQTSSGCLIEDNIVRNVFPNIEVNDGASGNAICFNFFDQGSPALVFSIDTNHGSHNALNLYEGNITPIVVADGYFGSVSTDTLFRNWITGSSYDGLATSYTVSFKRFTRDYSMAGNVVGRTGLVAGGFSYGQPNIGNGSSTGTAEPTTGDFWSDWKATATLTVRSSNTAGTLTLNSGSISDGQLIAIRWNGGASLQTFTAGTVTGNSVPWTGGNGDSLPIQGSTVDVYMEPGGYQELDLDVENSTIDKGNYTYGVGGAAGSMSGTGGDAIPDSEFRDTQPSWWGALPWPAFDPTAPNASEYDNIPAGYRYVHGTDPPTTGDVSFSGPGSTTFGGSGTVTFA